MKLVKKNQKLHNPDYPLLIGEVKDDDVVNKVNEPSWCSNQINVVINLGIEYLKFIRKHLKINLAGIEVFLQYYDKNPIQKFNRLESKYKIKFMFKFEC